MGRLRQINPQNYLSSQQVSAEFENVIRYLNATEYGNKTLAELLAVLFDSDGNFAGPVEMRVDNAEGIQYRIGDYGDDSTGWTTLVGLDALRGESGSNCGTIGEPLLSIRGDFTATAGQAEFDFAHSTEDDVLVYNDGILLRETDDYTLNFAGGTGSNGSFTLTTPATGGEALTAFLVRAGQQAGYTRQDTQSAGQAVFSFESADGDVISVYHNGVLQRAGGANDYFIDHINDQIIFNTTIPSGEYVSFVKFVDSTQTHLPGLMMEARYVDPASGKILYDSLQISDNEIPTSKVNGLAAAMATYGTISVSPTIPSPTTDFWLDTSVSPNQLKFWDGTQYLSTVPSYNLPSFVVADAGKVLHVNPTGTGLVYDDIDLSSVVPKTYMGAANGVANLDSGARLPLAQLPEAVDVESENLIISGAVSDGNNDLKRIYGHKVSIVGIAVRTNAGTCNVAITVNGTAVTSTYAASVTPNELVLGTAIEVDATSASKMFGIEVSGASACSDLDVVVVLSKLTG